MLLLIRLPADSNIALCYPSIISSLEHSKTRHAMPWLLLLSLLLLPLLLLPLPSGTSELSSSAGVPQRASR
jgi:uncharacterized membrane protein